MNKTIVSILFCLSLPTIIFGQEDTPIFHGITRIELGYPHAGSYSKERPAFSLEQGFTYNINRRFAAGLETGIALYPGSFTIPLHALGTYSFHLSKKHFNWNHRIGLNLRAGDNSFFSYRYNTDLRWIIPAGPSMNCFVGIGGNFLWDRWGGRALNGTLNIGAVYRL